MRKFRKEKTKKFIALCMAASLTWTSVDASVFAAEQKDMSKDTQEKAQMMVGSEDVEIVGDFTITGGSLDTDYTYDENENVLTIVTNTAITIEGTTQKDSIVVAEGITANITLKDASITPKSAAPISIVNGATANITLVGENILTGGKNEEMRKENAYAGIYVSEGASLVIEGTGSLMATGGMMIIADEEFEEVHGAAGIGGNGNKTELNAGNITIKGGTIIAVEGIYNAYSIGSGYYSYSWSGERGSCKSINIQGGFVKANCVDSNTLSPVILTLYGADDGTIVDGGSGFPDDYCFDGVKTIGNKLYFYLPTGTAPTSVICGEDVYVGTISDGIGTFKKVEIEVNPTIDLSQNSVTFSEEGGVLTYTIDGETKFYSETATITADKETENVINIVKGEHNITLDNVSIAPGDASPMSIFDGATANIILEGNNRLTGGKTYTNAYAGIYVEKGATLGINGTGNLTATGASYESVSGMSSKKIIAAGIGGNGKSDMLDAGSIIINGGSVTAIGGNGSYDKASAIGGGYYYYASDASPEEKLYGKCSSPIVINGGSVKTDNITQIQNPCQDSNGQEVYLLTIANPESLAVTVDGKVYMPFVHSSEDTNLYTYITGDAHTVMIGDREYQYIYKDGQFHMILSSGMFTYTSPENLEYDGTAKFVTVTKSSDVTGEIGEITVKYYNEEGTEVTEPVNSGIYTIKLDVAESEDYSAVTDITSDKWTFTIKPGTLVLENVVAKLNSETEKTIYTTTLVNKLVLEGTAINKAGILIEGSFKFADTVTELKAGTNSYAYIFTPDDANYETVEGMVSITAVKKNSGSSSSSSSSNSSSSTPTQTPSTEQPGTEEPDTGDSSTENPGTEEPDTGDSSTKEPNTEEPGTGDSSTEEPGTENPGTQKPSNIDWKSDEKGVYYENEDGIRANGWMKLENEWYYFDQEGYRETDWVKDNGIWYHLNENGVMETSWIKEEGNWYYLDTNGSMKTGWLKEGETWYYLNADGSMETGWLKEGEIWYYLNADGSMETGWLKEGETWYYLNADGSMETGWLKEGETWYYLNADGSMKTGWLKDGETWYYLNTNGSMKKGWIQLGADWFYLNDNGSMAADTYIGEWYVDKNGYYIPSKDKKK